LWQKPGIYGKLDVAKRKEEIYENKKYNDWCKLE
jgi:hypothetical protein